ncbi:hypothetical protein KBD59_01380 [Candidatus Gracilibacteria bacterium]|nr:hypothetical protein [Candidatus Gracilibacteria bacterium]
MGFRDDFLSLQQKAPRIGLQCVDNENSPYCQYTEKSKNCYMTFASYSSQDCMYNTRVFYCTDCVDCALCQKCELCYECVDCIACYNCSYSLRCENGINLENCMYCIGSQDCFGCVGLNKKQYCIFNEQYTKEAYFEKLKEVRRIPQNEMGTYIEQVALTVPRPLMDGKSNEECFGNTVYNSKNCFWVFDSKGMHDSNYIYHCDDSKDLLDCSHLGWSEGCYEIMSGGNLNNCMFCYGCWNSSDLEYCDMMHNSHDCFGCIGLNHAKYAIFNVAYEKEDYFKRVAEIKEQMKIEGSYGKWFDTTYPEVLTYGL